MSPSSGDLGDLSMFDLFRLEVESQTATLSAELLKLEQSSFDAQTLESLMRAAHSIKGAARMVSVNPVVNISHVLEDVFVAAQESKVSLGSDDIDSLLSAVDNIIAISAIPEKEIKEWERLNGEHVAEIVDALQTILSGDSKGGLKNC